MTARLCVLVSGRGRNLQALQAACADGRVDARITQVISNRPDAPALGFAEAHGIATTVVDHHAYAGRAAFDAALAAAIDTAAPDWLLLAGFMRILGDDLVLRYTGRMLNIHPSLLPRHRGLNTHEAVLAAGEAEHGASVHFVTPELDGGPVIIQGRCRVLPQDSVAGLADRVLQEIELRIYPQATQWAVSGRLAVADGTVMFDGRARTSPLTLDDLEDAFR